MNDRYIANNSRLYLIDYLLSQASRGEQSNHLTCSGDMRDTYPFCLCLFDHIARIVLLFYPEDKFTYDFEEHKLERKDTV